jgi:hypothetical protein
MGMSVHGFGFSSRPKQLGHLLVAFLVGFFGKGKIFAVGLGFTGKCVSQILFGLTHTFLLLFYF